MTRAFLLDVNVLVALFDPDHVHHEAAHSWFGANRKAGWATCPLTENGLVRILANSAYTGAHETAGGVRARLRTFCASGDHLFWPDEISLRDERIFKLPSAVTLRQITDVYLLGLARHHKGRLATFDRRVPIDAIRDGDAHDLEIISA